jgi:hypothetical protein
MSLQRWLAGMSLLALAPIASAQSTIYGLDVRLARFFTTNTTGFVANFTSISGNPTPVFALDFDETATTLWGVNNTTLEYGTFDLTVGSFTPNGVVTGPPLINGATGLTCTVGGQWFLSSYDGVNTNLWVGNVTTGTFTLVGPIGAGIFIDISIDSQGNMFAHNISTDTLYSVDTTTGAGTLLGVTGLLANFAQGMDFDWSTDTLYATIYTGGGVGNFCSLNTTTGVATILDVTTSLNAEMEISVQSPAPTQSVPLVYCTAGTSTNGCNASINASANPSASLASPCLISVANVEGQKSGLIFYSVSGQNAQPWSTGSTSFLCVKSPTQRTPTQTTGGTPSACDGTLSLDWNAYQSANPGSLGNPFSAGDQVWAQAWYRDPPAPKTTNLSNAIEMTMLP